MNASYSTITILLLVKVPCTLRKLGNRDVTRKSVMFDDVAMSKKLFVTAEKDFSHSSSHFD
jgi:hypothetical protein